MRYAHERAGVPVFVTEHGLATDDDTLRADFIEPLAGLHNAIDDGVPVLGYVHWTLLDNFEWIFGFDKHLGLVAVDRKRSIARRSRAPRSTADRPGQRRRGLHRPE